MTRALGLHIENEFIVAAIVEKNAEKLQIETLAVIDDVEQKIRREKLGKFLRKCPQRVAASLPAHRSILRKFSVPFTKREDIAQIIHFESEKHIPSYPVEQLSVDFHVLQIQAKETRLLVAAVQRSIVEKTIVWCENRGVSPLILEMDVFALLHAAKAVSLDLQGPTLLLELHTRACNLLSLCDGDIVEARAVPLKIDSVLDGVNVDVSDTVELVLHQEGITPQLREKIYKRVEKELGRTLLSAQPNTRIYYCGRPELVEHLGTFLENRCKIAAAPFDLSHLNGQDAVLSQAIIAIGLAVKAAENTRVGCNFRKDGFEYQKNFQFIKLPLAVILTSLFLLLLTVGIALKRPLEQKKRDYDHLLACAKQMYAYLDPDTSWEKVGYWHKIDALEETIDARIEEMQRVPQIQEAAEKWPEIFAKLAPIREQYYFTVEKVTIGQEEVLVEGRAENMLCFDLWQKNLREISGVAPGDNSLGVLESQELEDPENKKLIWWYKFFIRLQ